MAFLINGAASGLYGGHLSDRIGWRAVVVASLLLFTPITVAVILSHGLMLWVWVVASGVFLIASFSVTVVMAQELIPRHLGLASGLIFN